MIITLSRQLGSEGDQIARRVADDLNLRVLDREVIQRSAVEAGIPVELLGRLLYEGQRSLAADILTSLGTPTNLKRGATPPSPLLGVFAPPLPQVALSLEDAAQAVGRLIQEHARTAPSLVLGQSGQMWLKDQPGACHVQIVAPIEVRVARLAQREQIRPAEARQQIRISDRARAEYLARHHGVRWLEPTLYHLVINTGNTPIAVACDWIIHAARTLSA